MLRSLIKKITPSSGMPFRGNSAPAGPKGTRFNRLAFEPLETRLVLDSTVVFNEIMYNPPGATEDTLEYVELYNQLAVNMDISEWLLEGGIDYTFPDRSPADPDGTVVPGRGFLVIVPFDPAGEPGKLAQFEAEYDIQDPVEIIGPFTSRLSNGGEELRLINNDGRQMNVLDYGDDGDWPVGPDGGGVSLAKRDRNLASEPAENWTFSADMGGTPGAANVVPSQDPNAGGSVEALKLNEVESAREADFWLEIANLGEEAMDLGGFVLKATGASGGEHVFDAQPIAAGGFLEVTEAQLGFQPRDGEKLFFYTPGENQLVDARLVTNRLRGRSEQHDGQWLYPDAPTPGEANSFSFHDQIVINEIMYQHHPWTNDPDEPLLESDEEWIELYNRGTTLVDLGGWKLEDAVDYEFEAGTTLAPDEYLVVAKDATALRAKYPSSEYPSLEIVGNFSRSLSNVDDRILLVDVNENPADEVHYFESGRWSLYADGGGSSLELRDPFADNSKAEAWAPSDESEKSSWKTYEYTAVCSEPLSLGANLQHFILGLLDEGEFYLDDVRVRRDPDGANAEVITNGSFENDSIGSRPSGWRLVGNHNGGTVQWDPEEDPGDNKVLHIVAAGPQQHIHDHVTTDFGNGETIRDNQEYKISLKAKWIAGSPQVNNRFYFTRMSNTFILEVPQKNGTPGEENSTYQANVGPTYSELVQDPVFPEAGEPVTISVRAEDPQGVDRIELRYSINEGGFGTRTMTLDSDGLYKATIPGQAANGIVQFYVRSWDTPDEMSTFPAAGADSRALYIVDGSSLSSQPIDTVRIIMLPSDRSDLIVRYNEMSNMYFGCSVVHTLNYGEGPVDVAYHDVEVRQIGSRFIRPNSGYKIRLRPDQKFYGEHGSIRLDMSIPGEIYMKHMVARAGGSSVSMYDDVVRKVDPRHGTSTVLLQLARYEDTYLNEQFADGNEGTKWELDDIVIPTSPVLLGYNGDQAIQNQDIRYRGSDPEFYRGHLLIKNQRYKDNYQKIVDLAWAINRQDVPGPDGLYEATNAVMDVDLWMRHYATQAFLGNWDTYGFRRPKNLRIYVRPEDGKIIPLYWDADRGNLNDALIYNSTVYTRLDDIRDIPHNLRLFWGHMWDLMNRSFNRDYMAPWMTYYSQLGVGMHDANRLNSRVNTARNQARGAILEVPFQITTNGGNSFSIHEPVVTLEGDGWIDVREIRLAGSTDPLDVTWTDSNSWQMILPLVPGANEFNFEAFGYDGGQIANDNITVTCTIPNRPLHESLRITEINYNPADPTPAEQAQGFLDNNDFEFIEFQNVGDETLDLSFTQFSDGIVFEFTGVYEGPPVLITEVGTGDPDLVEIQNVSGNPVNTSGWFVVVNNADDRDHAPDINAFHSRLWHLPDSLAADEARYRSDIDDGTGNHWGANIFWRTTGPGWAMLVNDDGNVADFAVWGYSEAEIASLQLDVNGFEDITVADAWQGEAVDASAATSSTSLQRTVDGDHDDATDWEFTGPISAGATNEALTIPFSVGPFEFAPGQLAVVTSNALALEARYGTGFNFAGNYTGQLSNGGERLVLVDPFGGALFDFQYGDSNVPNWPGRADGKGASLEPIDPLALPESGPGRTAYLEDGSNWRSSSEYGGSPGFPGTGVTRDVVVNEVLSHTDFPLSDTIELYNTTGDPIDVGGWYLSDSWGWESEPDNGNYKKFRIPDGTTIPAGGYLVFDEDEFNPTWNHPQPEPGPNDFALNGSHGDDVWLMEADAGGKLTRFVDHVEFGAAVQGESWGRWPNGQGDLYPMTRRTLDKEHPENGLNSGPRPGLVIISEVHYNPNLTLNDDDLEFVEIYNSTRTTVDLTDWRIRGGIDYDFPAGTMLDASSTLVVVPFDLSDTARWPAFCAEYDLDAQQTEGFFGGYDGQLDDDGERIELQRPDEPPADEPWFIPRLLEDEVRYDNEQPWPTDADGGGDSLSRTEIDAWGNTHLSWAPLQPTPGETTFLPVEDAEVVGRHIFYNQSDFDGDSAAADLRDDDAIATDKQALLPGGTATFANYTSYSRGINAVMIDVDGLRLFTPPEVDDFQFRIGNSDDPGSWAAAPTPSLITVRPGEGVDGSDRVTLLWPQGAIQKQWLQVTVLTTDTTGMAEEDVFYFGNAIGEMGNSTAEAKVNATDMLGARNHQRTFIDPAPIDFDFDFDRDARVNATDMLIARNNQTNFLTALKLITVPPGKAGDGAAKIDNAPAHDVIFRQGADRESAGHDTWPDRWDWLSEFDQTRTQNRPADKDASEKDATDRFLVAYWL